MDFLKNAWYYTEAILLPELATYETEAFAAATIASLLLLAVLLWCLLGGGRRKSRYVCLLGLSDAGKTLLFMRLKYSRFVKTQSSINENKAQYFPQKKKSKPTELVDVPGDERVRERVFSKYRSSLRALVVVVDSASYSQLARNVAELLYDLLSEKSVYRGKVPLLVACNKQDLALARSSDAIQKDLEKEITSLRVSRGARLAAIEGGKSQNMVSFIGKKGKDFEFSDLPCKVVFVECSGRGKGEEEVSEADIGSLQKWIDSHC